MDFDLTIPVRTLTMNQMLRMNPHRRKRALIQLAWMIRERAIPPAKPIVRARVTIYRYSPGEIDPDGVGSLAKGILDVLQPCSRRHPVGLGFITNDSAKHLDLVVMPVKSQAVATRIVIQDITEVVS